MQRCGAWGPCAQGIGHLCENVRHLGWGACAGTWAELVAIDDVNAHRVPDSLGFAAASLVEPAAVCFHSLPRARFEPGMSVFVIGDGPFGFLHAQWARALGARAIVVAGHHDARLQRIAAATGAAGSGGLEVAIEATSSGSAPGLGVELLRPRGTLIIFSYIWKPNALEMGAIHMKELNVLGSCRSLNAFPACIDAMARKELDAGLLLDALLPMKSFEEALGMMRKRKDQIFKVGCLRARVSH